MRATNTKGELFASQLSNAFLGLMGLTVQSGALEPVDSPSSFNLGYNP
jgi:hypothetical protein